MCDAKTSPTKSYHFFLKLEIRMYKAEYHIAKRKECNINNV